MSTLTDRFKFTAPTSDDIPEGTTNLYLSSSDQTKIDNLGTNANRDLTISTSTPTSGDGVDGDVWYVYS
ncbi:MAG: hypothetical protein R3230_00475 [Nitrosopumilaceae archaeon]|nr:hypothetical protein [Nitrosopumilaceae archaeon]